MTAGPPLLRRRDALRGWLGLAMLAGPGIGAANAQGANIPGANPPGPLFPDGVTLTVAGPESGELDVWADTLLPALGRFLPTTPPMRRILTGGLDGITGANQFAAQAQPDGSAALLAPGTALLGWLFGDARVKSDLGLCVPLLAGFCPTVIAGRIDPATLAPGQKIRIGISAPNGPEMAVVLGLERLGLVPVPVPGLVDLGLTRSAFAQHTVDVMLVRTAAMATALAAASDARPICVLGTPNAMGAMARDPAMPGLPHLGELLGGMPADPLTDGWGATAVAAQLAFDLLLPPLTPAAMIALWRRATDQLAALPEVTSLAGTQAMRLHHNPIRLAGDAPALAALRAWFADHRRR